MDVLCRPPLCTIARPRPCSWSQMCSLTLQITCGRAVQISFARFCMGADLPLLTDVLCKQEAAPLQIFLLYQLGFESTPDEGIVASDASVGEAMQAIMAVHGFGRIQLHVRWSV